ncbi:MAG: hypothetical protein ACRC0G_07345 [Fusobacteriaceae bacterium]
MVSLICITISLLCNASMVAKRRRLLGDVSDIHDTVLAFLMFIGTNILIRNDMSGGIRGIIFSIIIFLMILVNYAMMRGFAMKVDAAHRLVRFATDPKEPMLPLITSAIFAGAFFTLIRYLVHSVIYR